MTYRSAAQARVIRRQLIVPIVIWQLNKIITIVLFNLNTEVYKSVKIYPTNLFKPQEILSQIHDLSDYKVNKQRHFASQQHRWKKRSPRFREQNA
jgi:hypothetical protein